MCDDDKIEDLESQIKDLEGKIGKIGDGLHRHIESPFPHSYFQINTEVFEKVGVPLLIANAFPIFFSEL